MARIFSRCIGAIYQDSHYMEAVSAENDGSDIQASGSITIEKVI
jgi:hypothetical protein